MDEDALYGAAPSNESPAEEKGSADSVDEQNADSSEVVVPNSILAGPGGAPPKEGDTILVKVVKTYGDECSIAKADEGETAPAKSGQPVDYESEIDAMGEENG